MTIGDYIRKRREAAGITIEAIAASFGLPGVAEAIMAIEAGTLQPTEDDLYALWTCIGFSPDIAMAILGGVEVEVCRDCGCSEQDACVHPDHGACWWVSAGWCSHCANNWTAATISSAPIVIEMVGVEEPMDQAAD